MLFHFMFNVVIVFFKSDYDFILTIRVSLLYLWLIPMGFDAYRTPFGVVHWPLCLVLCGMMQCGLCTLGVSHVQ